MDCDEYVTFPLLPSDRHPSARLPAASSATAPSPTGPATSARFWPSTTAGPIPKRSASPSH